MMIEIYTDGSCLNNPWNGWWAYLLRYKDKEKTNYAGVKDTTNNKNMQGKQLKIQW